MINFYHKGRNVCSMPTEGAHPEQIKATKSLLADKLKSDIIEITIKYSNPELDKRTTLCKKN